MRVALLLAAALIAACSAPADAPVVASDVRIADNAPGMAAAYMAITNNTGDSIAINSVQSPQYESASLHETTEEDGVSRMRRMDALLIPAHEAVSLEPGGKHLMLMRATGETDIVELNLYADDLLVLSIRAPR